MAALASIQLLSLQFCIFLDINSVSLNIKNLQSSMDTICPFVSSVTMKKSTICVIWASILMDMEFSNLLYLFPGYDQWLKNH